MIFHHISAAVMLLLAAPAFACLPAQGQPLAATAANRRVDALFASVVRADGPGCAVGVYRHGEILLAKGYGLAN
ncbi:MAG: hypothetical protein ABIR59_02925, partial [Gemmatimonadales bacterium]